MKKKGFTLVELLATIVVLSVIALIAIPLIGNVIEKAKIGALENSVNGLVESANMYYANQSIKGDQATETIFDFANGEQTSTEKLEYKGKVYNGKLILHANGEVAVCIDDKEHYAYKNKDSDEIISGIGTCLYDGTTGDFSSNSPVEDIKKQVAAATATSDKVLEGSTIYTLSGLVAGTMINNGSVSQTLNTGEDYTIPKGYHDGTGMVTANPLSSQTSATAVASNLLSGKTAWVNGSKITGTMTNKSGATVSATTITESGANALITIPENAYYSTSSKISVPIQTIKNEVSSIQNNIKSLVTSTLGRSQTFTYTFQKDARVIFCFAGATSTGRAGLTFNITGGTIIYDYCGAYQDGNNWTDMIIKVIDVKAGVTITATSNNYMSHYNILALE